MKRFGLLFGIKGKRKTREFHATEFSRNSNAAALKSLGYRVRKVTRPVKKGDWI